jgi:hypothetical protein
MWHITMYMLKVKSRVTRKRILATRREGVRARGEPSELRAVFLTSSLEPRATSGCSARKL